MDSQMQDISLMHKNSQSSIVDLVIKNTGNDATFNEIDHQLNWGRQQPILPSQMDLIAMKSMIEA